MTNMCPRMRYLMGKTTFLFILSLLSTPVHCEAFGDYLGYKACRKCHEELVKGWLKTRHASAFESLKNQGKEAIPGCLKCHVVDYAGEDGFIDTDLTPELIAVQCEACHGPGNKHVESQGKEKIGLPIPDEKKCRQCHTPGQNADFDYGSKIRKIHGL